MSGWQTLWIVVAILLSGPSTSGIEAALKELVTEIRALRADLRTRGVR